MAYRVVLFIVMATVFLSGCLKLDYDPQGRTTGAHQVILVKNIKSFELIQNEGVFAYQFSGKITEQVFKRKGRITTSELQKYLLDQMSIPDSVDLDGVECASQRWAGRLSELKKEVTGSSEKVIKIPAVGITVEVNVTDGARSLTKRLCTNSQGSVSVSDFDLVKFYFDRYKGFPTQLTVITTAKSPYPPKRIFENQPKAIVEQLTTFWEELQGKNQVIPTEEIASSTRVFSPSLLQAKAEEVILKQLGNPDYIAPYCAVFKTPLAEVFLADTRHNSIQNFSGVLATLRRAKTKMNKDVYLTVLDYYVKQLEPLYYNQILKENMSYFKSYRRNIKNNGFPMRYNEVRDVHTKAAMLVWTNRLNNAVKRGRSSHVLIDIKALIAECPYPSISAQAKEQYYEIAPKIRTQKAMFLDSVPIYRAADSGAEVLRRDPFGREYVILGKDGEYYRIEVGSDEVGYIFYDFVQQDSQPNQKQLLR